MLLGDVPKFLLEQFAPAMEPRAHRADRNIEYPGDSLIRELIPIPQNTRTKCGTLRDTAFSVHVPISFVPQTKTLPIRHHFYETPGRRNKPCVWMPATQSKKDPTQAKFLNSAAEFRHRGPHLNLREWARHPKSGDCP